MESNDIRLKNMDAEVQELWPLKNEIWVFRLSCLVNVMTDGFSLPLSWVFVKIGFCNLFYAYPGVFSMVIYYLDARACRDHEEMVF